MATTTYISPAMECVDDTAAAAKRAATKYKGTEFGTKCAILAMAADMVIGRMTLNDFIGITVAEVEATKR